MRTNGTHKNNNDNSIAPTFIGLHKATQETRAPHKVVMFSSKCIFL
jgi:hypothetical protein